MPSLLAVWTGDPGIFPEKKNPELGPEPFQYVAEGGYAAF